jgi:hypothetical protein
MAFVCLGSSANAAAIGYLEICKDSIPLDSLSGVFDFTIAGQSGTFAAPVGACTTDLQLPDGLATITEVPEVGSTVFSVDTFPEDRLISFDSITDSAVVQIVPGDISTETVITFTNTPIPEPGTGWLFGIGLALWALRRNLTFRKL